MSCSFDVKNGKLANVQYDGGEFNCSKKQLISLEGSPKEVEHNFDCSNNNLTNLIGGPEKVKYEFNCLNNSLTSLEGSPKEVGGPFNCSHNNLTSLKGLITEFKYALDCSDNPNLEDISNLPTSCCAIDIQGCPKITKFPEKIGAWLGFVYPTEEVRQRIKEVSIYEVLEENEDSIRIRIKNVGELLLDSL